MTERTEPEAHFLLLGTLECWAGGTRIMLGGPLQERVLTALLLEAGRTVPIARLVAATWDGESPATAPHQVRKAVATLRGRIPGGRDLIVTDGVGYRVVVPKHRLDLARFNRLAREASAEAAAGHPAEARVRLEEAIALWRGPLLGGTGGRVLEAASAALEERRLDLLESLFDLRLADGESAALVGPLREIIAGNPLRETPRSQLMLALYRSGRQAEALQEYERVRTLLAEELGVDPGERLRELHGAILRNDPSVAAPPAPDAAPAGGDVVLTGRGPVPCTLANDIADFTGRERELQQILDAARRPGDGHGTRVVAVDGMGGCGKTSLAVRAAHLLADDYPDGQLGIDLRGFTFGEEPLDPSAVIASLLATLGVPAERIPEDADGRIALWRATLAGRQVLLLLDNAVNSAQVAPLVPMSPDCLVLVTSRIRLVELDGAEWLSLDVMSPEESTALIVRVLGQELADRESEAVAELAGHCGHLPLALRISTARLRNRPRWTVRNLTDRLGDETRRLDELHVGDRSVAATLRLSYRVLDPRHRAAFRALGLHPGKRTDVWAAAALLGTGAREAEEVLEHLLDMQLLQQPEFGAYAFHDLVGAFARSLPDPADLVTGETDRTALGQLLDYWILATDAACALLFPGRSPYPAEWELVQADLPPLTGPEEAEDWFDRELDALVTAVGLARRRGMSRRAVRLARNVVHHLNLRSRLTIFQEVAQEAVKAAREGGTRQELLKSLGNLASACWKTGRFGEGVAAAAEGLEIGEEVGDRHGQAFCLDQLGLLHISRGDLPRGRDLLEGGIARHRENGSTRPEAVALCNLSSAEIWLGRFPEALAAAERSRDLCRRLGDRDNEIAALNDMAIARLAVGDAPGALEYLEPVARLSDDTRMPENLALTRALTAEACQLTGEVDRSARQMAEALELVCVRGNPVRRSAVENIAGTVAARAGDPGTAFALHRRAVGHAQAIGLLWEEARGLAGMASAARALGRAAEADRHERAARALFDRMGVPSIARPSCVPAGSAPGI